MKRISVHDVAARAGTSPATVSKVLTAMSGSRIPEDTAERVREAARALRYTAWSPARSLRRQRTDTVAIIIRELTPYFAEIVRGVAAAARERGLATVLAIHEDDHELEAKHAGLGLHGQVDGLVVVPARANRNQRVYDELRQHGVPFVFVDRYIPGYAADYVGLRNEEAAHRLTQALIAQGAGVIGCIAGRGGNTALAERVAGQRRAVAEAGLAQDEDLHVARPGETLREIVARLVARRPRADGLFWASYAYIQPALGVLAAHGLRVPEDVRFAGFDQVVLTLARDEDYQALPVIRAPWPTAIQPAYEMGQRAAEILVQARACGSPNAPQHVRLEPRYEGIPDVV